MIATVRLSRPALDDLAALHRWISDRTDAEAAHRWLDQVESRLTGLADFPARGRPRDDLASGVRTLLVDRNTLAAYRVAGQEVLVLRVIDGRRALPAVFGEE